MTERTMKLLDMAKELLSAALYDVQRALHEAADHGDMAAVEATAKTEKKLTDAAALIRALQVFGADWED